MSEWYERFSLDENPFELDPFKCSYTFVNHKNLIETILYLVKSGNICVLEGEEGSGKTMFLKQITDFFKGEGKVAYIDANIIKDVDIEEVILKRNKKSLLNIFASKPKDMILLLDNVEHLSNKNCEKIKYYFDQGHIKSVILATSDYKRLDISDSLRNRILHQIYAIPQLNKYDALRIVRDRFPDTLFLADQTVIELFNRSQKNIKRTITYCEKLCRYTVKLGKGEALLKYIPLAIKELKSVTYATQDTELLKSES
jgi:predicted AAA+ superfamily ATPase